MSRSIWKGPYCSPKLWNQIHKNRTSTIKTQERSSIITPEMIGRTIEIHNGKIGHKLIISHEHVGYKLGEFSPTKIIPDYKNKNKKRKK